MHPHHPSRAQVEQPVPGSELMAEAQEDRLCELAGGDPPQIEALWQRVHEPVFMH
jgi:hypothetical protein